MGQFLPFSGLDPYLLVMQVGFGRGLGGTECLTLRFKWLLRILTLAQR